MQQRGLCRDSHNGKNEIRDFVDMALGGTTDGAVDGMGEMGDGRGGHVVSPDSSSPP